MIASLYLRSAPTFSYSMSGIDDCASQEIEVSTSSNSTRNSKKYSFLQSIFNTEQSQNLYGRDRENTVLWDRDSKSLELEKREFIKNWILAQDNTATSPRKTCPPSPVLNTVQNNTPAKRVANSRIADYQWKRVRRDIDAKEKFGVSSNGRTWRAPHAPPTARTIVTIENEKPRDREPEIFMNTSNNDSDKTCTNSPGQNGNTTSSALNAGEISYKFSGVVASNERRSLIRESSKVLETSSLSSPVWAIDSAQIDCGSTKHYQRDTKKDGRSAVSSEISWIAAERSRIKLAARHSSKSDDRRSRDHDNPTLPDKLSAFSPFGGSENIVAGKDIKIDKHDKLSRRVSWLGTKNSPARLKSGSTSRNDNLQSLVRQSSKLSNALSASSALCESDCIDVESSTTNPAEEEIKIESDSDDTASNFIENVETQKHRGAVTSKNICKIEDASSTFVERRTKRPRDVSCDSDETYYSDGDRAPRLQSSVASSLKDSQRISQDKSDILISQVISPLRQNLETSGYVAPLNTSNDNNKKKRKAKKGSLLAKLQSLVSLQASNLRIWRHQVSQQDFKGSRMQFVTVKIRDRETRWGRHYITASVIADSHCLLESLFTSQSNSTSQKNVSSFEPRIVTLMIVPEITGKIIIRADSTLNIYPPWDVMDRDRKILNVMYFNVIANLANVSASGPLQIHTSERVIQKFDCPCIRAKAIVDSCPEKFSEGKPSVMRALFGS